MLPNRIRCSQLDEIQSQDFHEFGGDPLFFTTTAMSFSSKLALVHETLTC